MEPKRLWTSDTHFYHANVITYCDRPFKDPLRYAPNRDGVMVPKPDVEMMNRVMIERWNSVVGPRDHVYHLGDFAMGPRNLLAPTLKKLNGYKFLVRGNHDRSASAMHEAGFDEVYESIRTEIGGVDLYMHHQPEVKARWQGAEIMLCGHVHEKWRRKGNMINVGVDQWDFTPRTLQELLAAEEQGDWPTPEEMT